MQTDALGGNNKVKTRPLTPGGSLSFFLKEPSFDTLPKTASPGDFLTGSITYLKKDSAVLGCGTKPGGFGVRYLVADTKPPSAAKDDKDKDKGDKDKGNGEGKEGKEEKKEKESGLEVAVREAKVKYFKSQVGAPDATTVFDTLYPTAVKEHPTDLPLALVGLSHRVKCKSAALGGAKKASWDDATVADALVAADLVGVAAAAVTALITQDAVARDLGVNVDKDDAAAVAGRKESDAKKAALVEAAAAVAQAALDRLKLVGDMGCTEAAGATDGTRAAAAAATTSSATGSASISTTSDSATGSAPAPVTAGRDRASLLAALATTAGDHSRATFLSAERSRAIAEFESSIKQLQKWDDLSKEAHWLLFVGRLKLKNRFGQVLKKINDMLASAADNKKGEMVSREALFEERNGCYKQLGWTHAIDDAQKWGVIASKDWFDPF